MRPWGIGLLCAVPVLLVAGLLLAFTVFGIAAAVLALLCAVGGSVLVVLDDRTATARRRP
jgi:hypothetical protein